MHKEYHPFWQYESPGGNYTSISIRGSKSVYLAEYYIYLGKFINDYGKRIISVREPYKLNDGTIITMINLGGNDDINF